MADFLEALGFLVALAASGAIVGVVAGLLIVGGGVVAAPVAYAALQAVTGAPASVLAPIVVATVLVALTAASGRALLVHRGGPAEAVATLREGATDRWALAALGAVVGGALAGALDGRIVAGAIGLAALGFGIFQAATTLGAASPDPLQKVRLDPRREQAGWALVGGVSAFLALGPGALGAPFLRRLGTAREAALGDLAALGVVLGLAGLAGLVLAWVLAGPAAATLAPPLTIGPINVAGALALGAGLITAGPLGARLAVIVDPRIPRIAIAFCLAAAGLSLAREAGLG